MAWYGRTDRGQAPPPRVYDGGREGGKVKVMCAVLCWGVCITSLFFFFFFRRDVPSSLPPSVIYPRRRRLPSVSAAAIPCHTIPTPPMNQEEKFLQGGKRRVWREEKYCTYSLRGREGETIVTERKTREICMPKKIRVLSACPILIVFLSFLFIPGTGKPKWTRFLNPTKMPAEGEKAPLPRRRRSKRRCHNNPRLPTLFD